ncbi:restriction endonuclease [Pulveribacter suum]|uniref:Restriction endonuclease n=1 Tax=Pulveribacter suum TaxID=2116657 RepID=A0A2P1NNG2_9BURK|nr:restriction endonuclease [Pulveribacter suum]AVP58604.1 restriction endonuclease [Pulveribacter suum]
MQKPLSKSQTLAAKVMFAALELLLERKAQMKASQILDTIEDRLALDDWAREVIESNGLPRWRMYAHFFSVDAVKAGFLVKERGLWGLTDAGVQALAQGEQGYFLLAQQGYRRWKARQLANAVETKQGKTVDAGGAEEAEPAPPEARLADIQREVEGALTAEILERIAACSPAYFERLVVQLMIKMGYGGSREEAGRAVGRSGDGGIDGVINEDRLGLDAIYLQAKRWANVVGRPDIQQFVGALAGQRASKGVFITTSRFTQEARDYAAHSNYKVVLIDGERLADLMIEHDLGVSVAATYQLKRIDSDFFTEE